MDNHHLHTQTNLYPCLCYGLTKSVGFVRGVAHDGDADDPVANVTGTFMFT